jgi:hypothetical protein
MATKATTLTAAEDKEWADLKKQLEDAIRLFGGLLFTPAIFLMGLIYGIRAGLIAGTEHTLKMLKDWGK